MDELIRIDQQLLLALNGSESTAWDAFFMAVTHTSTWVPLFVFVILALLWRRPWRDVVLMVACTALVVLLADRFSSGVCKPLFHRFRPSHEPALEGLVDLVGDHRGGLYGFFSSHAANTFGVATFIALCLWRKAKGDVMGVAARWRVAKRVGEGTGPGWLRRFCLRCADVMSQPKLLMAMLYVWALLSSYSRIYLGLHYPGDILAGVVWGVLVAWLVCRCAYMPLRRRITS